MSRSDQKNISANNDKQWLIGSAGITAILIIGYAFVDAAVSDSTIGGSTSGGYAGLAALFAFVFSIICIVSIFKVKKWRKLLPIICLIICLGLGSWALFVSSFSSYGSSY